MCSLAMLIPGSEVPYKMINDPNGPRLRREEVVEALREFYRLRGWDLETGLPSVEYLRGLGLDWLVPLRNKAAEYLGQGKA